MALTHCIAYFYHALRIGRLFGVARKSEASAKSNANHDDSIDAALGIANELMYSGCYG